MSFRISSDVAVPSAIALVASGLAVAFAVAAFAISTRTAGAQETDQRYPWLADAPHIQAKGARGGRKVATRAPFNDANGNGVSYAARAPQSCAPAAIQSKLESIARQCGALEVISTHRPHARVRFTRHASLHQHCGGNIGAADFRLRDYACARRELADWEGGQSTDPYSVGHLHISVGGHEGSFRHRRSKRAEQ